MKKDTKSLLWGILAGGVAGSVAALLFAPKPGKELRQDIADGTAGAIDKVQEVASQAGDKGAELYGKAKDAVSSVVSEVKEWRNHSLQDEEQVEVASVSGIEEDEAVSEVEEAAEIVTEDEAVTEISAVITVNVDGDKESGEPA